MFIYVVHEATYALGWSTNSAWLDEKLAHARVDEIVAEQRKTYSKGTVVGAYIETIGISGEVEDD